MSVSITSEDLSLIKQNNQCRYIKLQVINRDWQSVGVIKGRLISCNVSIDGTSTIQRTASVSMKTETDYLSIPAADISLDLQRDMPADYYIKLWAGIEDNNTLRVRWYSQGVYIIAQSSYSFDPATRTLSLNLVDLMSDLNGDRAGELHAFTSIIKNQQRIDDVMKNVMDLVGITAYSIEPITVLRPTTDGIDLKASEEDYMVPYDINFSVGVTAYEILDKLVNLCPYYQMGFDAFGTFYVRKQLLEQDDSYVLLEATQISDLILSEDTSIDWNYVKNHIEVWGKDGLYYGEAEDTNPSSPFQVNKTKLRRLVVKDNEYGIDTNSICDRYWDTKLAESLQKEQATYEETIAKLEKIENPTAEERRELSSARQNLVANLGKQKANVAISGNDLAAQWAERILYDRTRLQDDITIKTVLMPFINDVDFKISYRSKIDDIIRPYVVKSVNHDFAGGTTTINMIRFYDDMCVNYWEQLDKPIITNAVGINMNIVVTIENVEHAEFYTLYLDGNKVGTYTTSTIVYTVPEYLAGTHTVAIAAEAPYYRTSELSDAVTVTVTPSVENVLITDTSDYLVTNDGYKLKYNEG